MIQVRARKQQLKLGQLNERIKNACIYLVVQGICMQHIPCGPLLGNIMSGSYYH